MCGRYAITIQPDAMRTWFAYGDQPNFPPRYNVAPTQPVPVVLVDRGARRFALMRWGLIPSWVKDPAQYPLVFNVRSETVREKPSFRAAFQYRRCLMPADGYYEWQKTGGKSRPFLIRHADRSPFAFAAIWETYADVNGSEIDTVAILTTDANADTAGIHPRTPVILPAEAYEAWLDPRTPADEAHALLQSPPDGSLEIVPIGTAINAVSNDDASVQKPAPGIAAPAGANPAPPRTKREDDAQGSLF